MNIHGTPAREWTGVDYIATWVWNAYRVVYSTVHRVCVQLAERMMTAVERRWVHLQVVHGSAGDVGRGA